MTEILDKTNVCTIRVFDLELTRVYTENTKEEEEEEEEEEEKKKKTTRRLIIILMTGGIYKALAEKWLDGSQ